MELGYTVRGGQGEDPELIDPGGSAVETWREDYPYEERMSREEYELEKYRLQVELLKFQYWGQDHGLKNVIVFEGRDAAGKGGTIKRFTEHLDPRSARTVALSKPSDREQGQWYFQRYIQHLPTAGEIVMFDRSWYNRANVERVMGFCTDEEYDTFMGQAPLFEKMLVDSGIHLTKFWFSVTRHEQRTRFAIRQIDPVRRWKLSPVDLASLDRWEDYTEAKERRSCAPTPTTRRGSPSSPTTRSGGGSTPSASSSTSSTTTTRTPRSSTTPTRSSCAAAAKPSATEPAGHSREAASRFPTAKGETACLCVSSVSSASSASRWARADSGEGSAPGEP